MFVTAKFIIAKKLKQLRSPPASQRIDKTWVIHNPLGFIVQKTGKLGLVKKDQKKYENLDLKETEGKNE